MNLNPYATFESPEGKGNAEEFPKCWLDDPMDLRRGIQAGGALTQREVRRAATIGREAGYGTLILMVVTLVLVLVWITASPDAREYQSNLDLDWFWSTIVSLVIIFLVVGRISRSRRREWYYEPTAWLFQEERFYSIRPDCLSVCDWEEYELHEAPDMVALRRKNGLQDPVFPRRFFDEEPWRKFCQLARSKMPIAISSTKRKPSPRRTEEVDTLSYFEAWNGFDFASPIVMLVPRLQNIGEFIALFAGWTKAARWWLIFGVSFLLALAVTLWLANYPRWQGVSAGVAIAFAIILVLSIFGYTHNRRTLERFFAGTNQGIWAIHESYIEGCERRQRSVFPWAYLSQGPRTANLVTLVVGESQLCIPLSRTGVAEEDWQWLIERIQSLPKVKM